MKYIFTTVIINILFISLLQCCTTAIINPPEGYEKQFGSATGSITGHKELKSSFDFIQIFAGSASELERQTPKILRIIHPDGILWVSYPKLSSDQKTDLSREKCREIMQKFSYRPVSQISVDEVWSALRFKPEASVVSKKIETPSVDTVKRIVKIPKDLKAEFLKNKKAEAFFNTLSFTHMKEYVLWIETAKKEETRAVRVSKTVTMLANGIKARS